MNSPVEKEKYTINNDVILTKSGLAFLIGGNHSVLNYITEKSTPSLESFENFTYNIARRAHISKLANCKYLHVIFPDKQSVLDSEFPISTSCRLGDKYLESISKKNLNKYVVYPADFLKKNLGYHSFEKLDTHLSDSGSLFVLAKILDLLGIAAQKPLKEIQDCINLKIKSSGDLGGKFTPPLIQETIKLNPNWNHAKFGSNGSSNNGQIDIYLGPESFTDQTLLIFGDSFFRLMLTHLSKIFKKIIFLRTPHFHTEMLELIRPNIVLTGNAERYLANVSSDANAPAFQLYTYSHNSTSKPSPPFINAYRAMTSPNAVSSKKFFSNFFDETAQSKKIIGPSHIVRWGNHLKNGLLSRPNKTSDLVGFGGAPVWSSRLHETAKKEFLGDTKILLMVGDFRFGNEISMHPSRDSLPLFNENYSGISSKAITPENDQYMLQKSHAAINAWNNTFNDKIYFIFWDLFCRQVQDRLAGRHINNKKYQHPHWNLNASQGIVPPSNLIDLSPLLTRPMHEAMRLFIDPSSHPSQIGYLMIANCFYHHTDPLTSFNKAVHDVEQMIFSTAGELVKKKNKPILLFGKSVWLDTFLRYLGQSGREKLESIGIKVATFNWQVGHVKNLELTKASVGGFLPIFISDDGDITKTPAEFKEIINDHSANEIVSIAWEASCLEVISKRNETPQSLYSNHYREASLSKRIQLNDADIELGPYGYPTMAGILYLLNFI